MLLIVAATENEIKPLRRYLVSADRLEALVTGMGPVVAAASLSRYLSVNGSGIDGVLNIGVAGAYMASGLTILDICLAHEEFLGDFGICMQDGIKDFGPELYGEPQQPLLFNNALEKRIEKILHEQKIAFRIENFVTVNCCSGTMKRGAFLRDKFRAGCENMEGAAIAIVCDIFNIPCVELRCISNMVENRDTSGWRLAEASEKICRVAETILHAYDKNESFP